jgi:hypothetical protein
MRFAFRAVVVALAAKASFAFVAPSSNLASLSSSSSLETTALHASHYSRQKPSTHPDYKTNMNNFELDEFSGLPYEEAEDLREENRMRAMILAEDLQKEREEEEFTRIQAKEAAFEKAAAGRAAIREADEAKLRAIDEAREETRQRTTARMAQIQAEEEEKIQAMAEAREEAEQEYRELSDAEKKSIRMKQKLSDEDIEKMQGLTGWRRMQFMDNTLDGNIIKRFPRKHADHPDSRTNNKHIDMNNYVEYTQDEYEAMREEGRLEARRLMGESSRKQAEAEAGQGDAKMAAVQRGRLLRETDRTIVSQEAYNRIVVKKI